MKPIPGKTQFLNTTETTLIFQCNGCGDVWSPDITDPMLLDVYLTENPDGHVSIEKCESCENAENLEAEFFGDDDDETDEGIDWDAFWKEIADEADTDTPPSTCSGGATERNEK